MDNGRRTLSEAAERKGDGPRGCKSNKLWQRAAWQRAEAAALAAKAGFEQLKCCLAWSIFRLNLRAIRYENSPTHIDVVSSNGYEARLSEATVDVHKGTIISDKPVWVRATGTVVEGLKLEVRDSGNVIRFTGGVRMVMQPDKLNAQMGER